VSPERKTAMTTDSPGTELSSASDFRGQIIRHPTLRPLGILALKIVPFMTLVTAFLAISSLQSSSLSIGEVWFVVGLGVLVTLLAVWMLFVFDSNFGIVLIDEGVIVIGRSLGLGMGNQQLTLWNQLGEPSITGGFTNDITSSGMS
jgi:hypothetical protein